MTRIYSVGSNEIIGILDIDLQVAPGEMVVLKGNSGSGKSTLLGLLAGLDRPTQGHLYVAGQNLQLANPSELNRYRRDVVGMVFQSFNLLPTLTVLENVCLPAFLAKRPGRETRNQAAKLLHSLNLSGRMDHYPRQLSGGEMQRTAISMAIINGPSIILADEPTGNLDSRNGDAVIRLLSEINRVNGTTVIIATHSNLADPHGTLQIHLKDGVITEETP